MNHEENPTALALRRSVPDLVRTFVDCERDLREAFAMLVSVQRRIGDAFGCVSLTDRWNRLHFEDPNGVMVHVRRQIWGQLFEQLELRRFMSIREWDELRNRVERGKDEEVPPIDLETVAGMAQHYRSQIHVMLEAAVLEVYEWLIPRAGTRSDEYKTNDKCAVGRRVILSWAVDPSWVTSWHMNEHTSRRLSALENVMTSLDGKGAVTKTHYSAVETAIRAIPRGEPCVGETEYFRFRGHKNRTLHLEFKREEASK